MYTQQLTRILEYLDLPYFVNYSQLHVDKEVVEYVASLQAAGSDVFNELRVSALRFNISTLVARSGSISIKFEESTIDNSEDQSSKSLSEYHRDIVEYIQKMDYVTAKMRVDDYRRTMDTSELAVSLTIGMHLMLLGEYAEAIELLVDSVQSHHQEQRVWFQILMRLQLRAAVGAVYSNMFSYNGMSVERILEAKSVAFSFNIQQYIDSTLSDCPAHYKMFINEVFTRSCYYEFNNSMRIEGESISDTRKSTLNGSLSILTPRSIDRINWHYQEVDWFVTSNMLPSMFWLQDKYYTADYCRYVLTRYSTDCIISNNMSSVKEAEYARELSEITYDMMIRIVTSLTDNEIVELSSELQIVPLKVADIDFGKFVTAFENLVAYSVTYNSSWKLLTLHLRHLVVSIRLMLLVKHDMLMQYSNRISEALVQLQSRCEHRDQLHDVMRDLTNRIESGI